MSVVGKSRGSLGDAVSGGIGQLELFPELFRDFVVCFDAFLFLYKETSYITFQKQCVKYFQYILEIDLPKFLMFMIYFVLTIYPMH